MDLLDKMATYVRVLEAGSFSAAARQLRISPAAVSRQIATLEADLKVPLVLRSTRKMAVTPAGRRYYERCLRILREVEEAQAIGGTEIEGILRVNAPVTFGLACVLPTLHALLRKHPGLRLDLRLEDRFADLVLEGFDVAIRVGSAPPESTQLVAHRLVSYRRVLVAAPAYLKRRGEPKTAEALARHDGLTYATGDAADSWTLAGDGREVQVPMNVAFRSNALHAVRALALEGLGIAFLPEWFVAVAVERRALRVLLPEWRSLPVEVHAIHRTEHRGAPRVRALVDHLRAALAAPNPTLGDAVAPL